MKRFIAAIRRARAQRGAHLVGGRWLSVAGWTTLALALAGAVLVRSQMPWVPLPYLAVFVGAGVVAWRLLRWRAGRRLVRWPAFAVALAALIALSPVPWMKASLDSPPGTAWRLDGWLQVDGETIDPSGAWYWLTAGRPPVVGELVRSWVFDTPAARDLRDGRGASQPQFSEPAAAAVGLRAAGWDLAWGVHIELSHPTQDGLPDRAVLAALNDAFVAERSDWGHALGSLRADNSFTTDDGDVYEFSGQALPYRRIDVIEVPKDEMTISVGGLLAGTPPGQWFRSLAVGRSHGMMVALVTYAHFAGEDLAQGRTITGTGGIHADGSVSAIGGLLAKATAARDVGADVLLFPAQQSALLAGFDPGSMQLVPISTLDDAIEALRVPVTSG